MTAVYTLSKYQITYPYTLLLYVDDMLIASQSREEIQQLKLDLKSSFEMKDLGEARKILRIKIKRDKQISRIVIRKLSKEINPKI